MSLQSRPAIIRLRDEGEIFIFPFDERNLGNAQYDVRLGPYYWEEQKQSGVNPILNIFSRRDTDRVWGKSWHFAVRHSVWAGEQNNGVLLEGLSPNDLLIILGPGDTVLAHTVEFIGGARFKVKSNMAARSSAGRVGITVCKCAGFGDVGFCSRWTLEITNVMQDKIIPLPVGMRIAQLDFHEVESVEVGSDYTAHGKYQTSKNLHHIVASWDPEMMKPRFFADWEIRDGLPFHTLWDHAEVERQKFLTSSEGRT